MALDTADKLVGRDAVVVEDQLGAVDRLVAQLVELLAGGEALMLVGDEQAHALVARIGLGIGLDQQGEAAAVERVGNPGLGAVDDIVVAVTRRHGADRLEVGSGIGLGQRQAAADFAGGEPGQPLGLLLRRAEALDRGGHDQMRVDDPGDRHPVRRYAHDDLGIGRRRQPQPTVFLADGRAEQAHVGHFGDELRRPDVVVIVVHDHRDHRPFEPAVDRIHERGFLVGIDRAALVGHQSGWGCHCSFLNRRSGRSRVSTPARCACNG